MNQMRKVIQEAIAEALDSMGLPDTGGDFDLDASTPDQYRDIIAAGEKALAELGGAIDPNLLKALKGAHEQAVAERSLLPFHLLIKAGVRSPRVEIPGPDQMINIIKALAFSLDSDEDRELQKLLLQKMTSRSFNDRIQSYYKKQTAPQPSPSLAEPDVDIDNLASIDGIPVVGDMSADMDDDELDAMSSVYTVKETYRLQDMDLMGEADVPDETPISEDHSLELDRFAWGQAKEAPQPGVETDGQLTESRGSLIRNRYYGRY